MSHRLDQGAARVPICRRMPREASRGPSLANVPVAGLTGLSGPLVGSGLTSIMWFRRDLRLRDHPALRAAAASARSWGCSCSTPFLGGAGSARRAWLAATAALPRRVDRRPALRPSRRGGVGGAPDGRGGRGRAGPRHPATSRPTDGRVTGPSSRRSRATSRGWPPGRRTPSLRAPSRTARATPTRCSRRTAGHGAAMAGTTRSRRRANVEWLWSTATSGSARCWTRHCARHRRDPHPERTPPGAPRSFLERDLDVYAQARDDPGADRTSRLSPT